MRLAKILVQRFSFTLRSPINVDLLKSQQGQESLRKSMQARFKDDKLLDRLIKDYEAYRKNLYQYEQLSKEANDIKRSIKDLVKNNQTAEIEKIKVELVARKEVQSAKELELKASMQATEQLLMTVGNSVHRDVVRSKDEANNRVLKYFHPKWESKTIIVDNNTNHEEIQTAITASTSSKKSYQDLNNFFKVSDLSRGQKVSGHRGYFLCTNGVKLALGIAQYGLQFLQNKGYELYQTPALILEQVLKDSCQLSTIKTDMYRLPEDGLCLIATSQQTLAGYYRGETLQSKKLPLRMGGYSSCFRRQAGAHGKDIHGLFRLHQFQKVEQFVVCNPSQSENEMSKMVQTSEEFYQSLEIPYRLVDIVSGELNDPAVRKIDLQAWFPSQGRFRQLVSISNCTDYQSRLLETRFRQGTSTAYPHMLNGTLVAIQRAITCFLEHFYNSKTDQLDVPAPLQPFVRAKIIKRTK